MSQMVWAVISAAGLFAGMVFLMEFGRRIGERRAAEGEGRAGLGAVEGAVFALLGLLVAFTFSGAATRFDGRRHLIVEEVNNVGTAWLRLAVLPPEVQPALRESFRQYVDQRLEVYRSQDLDAVRGSLAKASALQSDIWEKAVSACRSSGSQAATMLLLPALNQMFDIATTRTLALQMHQPAIVFVMLGIITLISAFMAGYGMAKTPGRIHMLVYSAVMALSFYVIVDLEYPRLGLIRVDSFDQALVDLRHGMK